MNAQLNTKAKIAAEVRAELGRQNKTRSELAELAGISTTSIGKKVNGEVSFTADEIIRVAAALNVPVMSLLKPGIEYAQQKAEKVA